MLRVEFSTLLRCVELLFTPANQEVLHHIHSGAMEALNLQHTLVQ